ncbi:hypothetical protein ASD25_02545 [Brevundimonas sp. Root1423]|nr:hypothetical protein ASD25_02545 [Brevundimonas sp. Root1423]
MPNLREVRNGDRLDAGRVRLRGEQAFAGLTVETRYYFNDDGLSMIALEGPRRKCREMIAAIDSRYGPTLRIADEMILLNAIWHSEEDGARIRLMTSPAAGICTLHYEPLHLYREHDLASPGLLRRDPRRDPPFG